MMKSPPVPLPENLWGDRWRFGAIAAQDLIPIFSNRMIPVFHLPDILQSALLQIPSTTLIPGVIIDGGKQSMILARWLERSQPQSLQAIPGELNGLILEAGATDRWILATFNDVDIITAAETFRERLQAAKELHFLLVQPDDSGMTYSGFWLLQGKSQD